MITGAAQMKCGGCGGDKFLIYTRDKNKELLVECEKCLGVSVVRATECKPTIGIDWALGNDKGIITVF